MKSFTADPIRKSSAICRRALAQGLVAGCLALLTIANAHSQERWFQIEVSIFTNESTSDRLEENWQAKRTRLSFPQGMQRLHSVNDILLIEEFMPVLDIKELDQALSPIEPETLTLAANIPELTREESTLQAILAVQPAPVKSGTPFKFFDLTRDDYLQLPAAQSDFTQTNRTLDRSPNHRLLWHSVWRQAVLAEDAAKAIYVTGGERYNSRHELEGSLTIRFNDNADRVVIDTNLWLAEFSPLQSGTGFESLGGAQRVEEAEQESWQLPMDLGKEFFNKQQLFESANDVSGETFNIERIYHMVQSRGMRSNEFHYLDHPAIGVVVMVNPYQVPEVTIETDRLISEPSLTQ